MQYIASYAKTSSASKETVIKDVVCELGLEGRSVAWYLGNGKNETVKNSTFDHNSPFRLITGSESTESAG